MKKYLLNNNELYENDINYNIIFAKDLKSVFEMINELPISLTNEVFISDNQTRIDFYKDFFYGNIYLSKTIIDNDVNFFFIIHNNNIYFVNNDETISKKIVDLINKELDKYTTTFDNIFIIILLLLNIIVNNNINYVKKIQKKIDKLENTLIVDKEINGYNVKLLDIRKQLTKFRKENDNISNFIDIIEYQDNIVELYGQIIKLIDHKNIRTNDNIKIMIEHTIQIKEVYQNQLDVSLNNTMNLFTILSAIFLPLTLITSWYGMNFIIPEFKYKYGYLIPIILCLFSIVITIFLIKKYKFLKK
ncbi:Mg2+ and Co2+ transporter CorA [Bacilli bacterium PM5-3]|nr:Mg2+ and Co2+ transporter CorA [Bacilli bacterium PM5-3]